MWRKDSLKLPLEVDVTMSIVPKEKQIEEKSYNLSINKFKEGHGFSRFISHEKFKDFADEIINGNLQIGLEVK